jgi:hypothetical protein
MNHKKTIILKFQNWEQYNKRAKEYKNPVWFSFQNDFAINRNFFDFSDQNRLIFIYLLCEASRSNESGTLEIEVDHFAYITRQKQKDIVETINKLESKQILQIRDRDGIVTGSCEDRGGIATEQNRTGQNKTEQDRTRQDITRSDQSPIVFPDGVAELESLWLARGVKPTQLEAMLKAFPEPAWIMGEAKKAVAWEEANPSRRKKDFAKFLNNWLARAWDSRRVSPNQRLNEAEQREANNARAAKEALRLMGVEE